MTFPALILAAVAASSPLPVHHVMRADGDRIICTGATPLEIEEIEFRSQQRKLRRKGVSYVLDTYRERDITVDFDGDFPEEAKNAVIAAANIWDSYLLIEVPIQIEATYYYPAEEEEEPNWAAFASVMGVIENGRSLVTPALANQLSGRDLNRGDPEFGIGIKHLDHWYFGVDQRPPPDKLDLVSAILHEIAHGLGFISSLHLPGDFDEEQPTAGYLESDAGVRSRFDWFLWSREHGWLFNREDIENPSAELYEAATGIKLFWGGRGWTGFRGEPLHSAAAHGASIMLAASREFAIPSHLDPDAYPMSVIEPGIHHGQPVRIDTVVLGMLYDMGWELKDRGVNLEDIQQCLEEMAGEQEGASPGDPNEMSWRDRFTWSLNYRYHAGAGFTPPSVEWQLRVKNVSSEAVSWKWIKIELLDSDGFLVGDAEIDAFSEPILSDPGVAADSTRTWRGTTMLNWGTEEEGIRYSVSSPEGTWEEEE